MANTQSLTQLVESYRFAEVVALWARERLEHEVLVARTLAHAVVCEGLLLQSFDTRWAGDSSKPLELRGYPYVGYAVRSDGSMAILRVSALDHLIGIIERGEEPDMGKLHEEFIKKNDFRDWLLRAGLPLPRFWFTS